MSGEKNLQHILKSLSPILHSGSYVFVSIKSLEELEKINRKDTLFEFKEAEGISIILEKNKANFLKFSYDYIASWITLEVHSSLEAVGLTALFSGELAKNNISCNVVAGYYHDHIFVDSKDGEKALKVLKNIK